MNQESRNCLVQRVTWRLVKSPGTDCFREVLGDESGVRKLSGAVSHLDTSQESGDWQMQWVTWIWVKSLETDRCSSGTLADVESRKPHPQAPCCIVSIQGSPTLLPSGSDSKFINVTLAHKLRRHIQKYHHNLTVWLLRLSLKSGIWKKYKHSYTRAYTTKEPNEKK